MSYSFQRSPRVTLPPRTRDFNPLERHSRGFGCSPWFLVILAGLVTGVIIAVVTMWMPSNSPFSFLALSNDATATPTRAQPTAIAFASPTVFADANATITLAPTSSASVTATNTRVVNTATPTQIVPTRTSAPTVIIPPTKPLPTFTPVVTPATSGELQVTKMRFESDPPREIFATKRTLTFYVTMQNPNPSDYAIVWGIAYYRTEDSGKLSLFGHSAEIKSFVPPGVSEQASGTYQLQSGGEKICLTARAYVVRDDNPITPMPGIGQDMNFCIGS